MESSVNLYHPLNVFARAVIFLSNITIAATLIQFYFRSATHKTLRWWIRMGAISVFLAGLSSLAAILGNGWLMMVAIVSVATIQAVIAYQIRSDSTSLLMAPMGFSSHGFANRIQAEILRRTLLEEESRRRNERMKDHARNIEGILVGNSERTKREIERVRAMIQNKNVASEHLENITYELLKCEDVSPEIKKHLESLTEFFRTSLLNTIEQLHYLNDWIGSRNEIVADIRNVIDNLDNGP